MCVCVRAVRCELKFYILFTPISSLTGFTYLNPGLLARNEYQWGRFSDRPTRDRDFPLFFLNHRTDAQLTRSTPRTAFFSRSF